MTSQDLLQVALNNPKSFPVPQNSAVRKAIITLYLYGRCYPVIGGSRGDVGFTIHDHTAAVARILDKLQVPYRIGCDVQPKNLACTYIELI